MIIYLVPHLERDEIEKTEGYYVFDFLSNFTDEFLKTIKEQIELEKFSHQGDNEVANETGVES